MSDISKIKPNGTEYNLKDATARAGIESSKTLKSSVVTVTDAYPINAEDITVDITPKQDLHGYDRPWAGGAGKNKLPMTVDGIKAANTRGTWSGNTYNYDGTIFEILTDTNDNVIGIKVNRQSSSVGQKSLWFSQSYIPSNFAGMILNGITSGSVTSYFIAAALSNNGSSWATENDVTTEDVTISNYPYIQVGIIVRGGIPSDGAIFYPMIRLATETDPTFAPYSNICPIEGWTGAELDRVGKNWFTTDANDYEVGTIDPSTGALLNDSNYKRTKEYLPIRAGSYKLINAYNFRIFLYDSSKNYLGYVDGASVMTISNLNVAFYKARWPAGNDMSTAMLFLSSFIDSTYEPYQGEQYTASFGETVYGGKWHVTKGGTDKTHANIANYNGETINEPWLSSMDEYVAGATPTTGAQVVYPLTTHTAISTPKQNVPMLQGINTVYADCGDTQLKYQPDNVVGELKGEIRTVEAELEEAEANLEIVYEDHVANTSMGIIVQDQAVGDLVFSNALDIAKAGYTAIAVTDTSIVHSTVANQGEIATHCLLDVPNNRVRFYVHVMDSAASLTIPPNSLTFRVAYKKA